MVSTLQFLPRKVLPDDPVDYLANYLEEHAATLQKLGALRRSDATTWRDAYGVHSFLHHARIDVEHTCLHFADMMQLI